jgi:heme-degrading monooxygenase HmoA
MAYVVINAIDVPEERKDAFEERFATRAGQVSAQAGFEAFELMRPHEGARYLVYTRWSSKDDFDTWLKSEDFQVGHSRHNTEGPVSSHSELWTYDVLEGEYAATI